MSAPEATPDNELCGEITNNLNLYRNEPQERDRRQQLVDPLARMFEQRMNDALQQFGDYKKFIGRAVVQETGHEQAA